MKGVLGAWLALAIFSSPAAARLGETRQECIERYGEQYKSAWYEYEVTPLP